MREEQLRAGQLLAQAVRQAAADWPLPLAAAVLLTAAAAGNDLLAGDRLFGPLTLPIAIATVAVEYGLLRRALLRANVLPDGAQAGFGALFGMNLLSGLALLLAFALLIFPFVILWARWIGATGVLLAEGTGVAAALGESNRRARGRTAPIVLASAVAWLPAIAGVAAAVILQPGETATLAGVVPLNIGFTLTTLFCWYLGIAVYAATLDRTAALEEVFA